MEYRLQNKNSRIYVRVSYRKPRRMALWFQIIIQHLQLFSFLSGLLTFSIFQYAPSVFYQFHYIQWNKRGTTVVKNNCSIEKVHSKNNLTAWLTIKTKQCNIEGWCTGIRWVILIFWVILWSHDPVTGGFQASCDYIIVSSLVAKAIKQNLNNEYGSYWQIYCLVWISQFVSG